MQAVDLNFPNKVLPDPGSPYAKEMVPSGLQRYARWLVYALNVFLLGVSSHSFLCDHFLCRSSQRGHDANLLPCYTQLVPALRTVPTPFMESDPGTSTNRHSKGHLKHGSPGDFTERLENRCYRRLKRGHSEYAWVKRESVPLPSQLCIITFNFNPFSLP